MEIHNWYLPVKRTARIAMIGDPGPQIKDVWLVFHGYRQLATNFAKKFAPITQADCLIVAPEGLSRFYVDWSGRKVGASWMTKEERLKEIDDQFAYLNAMWEALRPQVGEGVNVHVLGFSQGLATAWRWLSQANWTPSSLICWAGNIPAEYDEAFLGRLEKMRAIYVLGDEDEFISADTFATAIKLWKEKIPHIEEIHYKGKHEILTAPLLELIAKMKE